jgi:hypothetical protein
MANMKLIISIVVAVVVVAVVVALFLPGMMGGGSASTTTSGTPTPTTTTTRPGGGGGGGSVKVSYDISVSANIRDPTEDERSRGVLKVVEFNYKISVIGTVGLKKIIVEIGGKNFTLLDYATPLSITNRTNYKIPLKLEVKTQSDLNLVSKAKKAVVYTILVVKGQEETDMRVVLLIQATATNTRSVPVPGGGIV